MKIAWTRRATGDLVRLHDFLSAAAPEAAAKVVQTLARAPDRLLDYPRIGEKLDGYAPREVRRIFVGQYELRYEISDAVIYVLRLWHHREDRTRDRDV
jgi:plasmid stabilization system protein ParE